MIELAKHPRGVLLPVKAQAGARQNAVLGEHNGMLRVAVTAAPEKGTANRAIIEVLADALHVAKSSIELAAGETSPQKRFLMVDVVEADLRIALDRLIGNLP